MQEYEPTCTFTNTIWLNGAGSLHVYFMRIINHMPFTITSLLEIGVRQGLSNRPNTIRFPSTYQAKMHLINLIFDTENPLFYLENRILTI